MKLRMVENVQVINSKAFCSVPTKQIHNKT